MAQTVKIDRNLVSVRHVANLCGGEPFTPLLIADVGRRQEIKSRYTT